MEIEHPRRFIEVEAWPAETFYFARKPENISDLYSDFLNFLAQRVNFLGFERIFSGILDDVFNLAASLAKLRLIFESKEKIGPGASRMAATEVEFILLVCRSLFDLLQEFLAKAWGTITLSDSTKRKKALKKSFSDMVLHADSPKTAEQIAEQFQLPAQIAACYVRHAPLFLKIREFRDNLVHRGSHIQTIFEGNEGFAIRRQLGPFRNLNIWRDKELQENNLVPLDPALFLVVHGTLAACEEFALVLMSCFKFPNPTVPEMSLFLRSYFNNALGGALNDASQRVGEGRSLISP